MKEIIQAMLAFFAVQAVVWFSFWIGGGLLFTVDAGALSFISLLASSVAAYAVMERN